MEANTTNRCLSFPLSIQSGGGATVIKSPEWTSPQNPFLIPSFFFDVVKLVWTAMRLLLYNINPTICDILYIQRSPSRESRVQPPSTSASLAGGVTASSSIYNLPKVRCDTPTNQPEHLAQTAQARLLIVTKGKFSPTTSHFISQGQNDEYQR